MLRCNVKPYEGDKEFIFISYSHKDNALVFPVIEKLAENGFRVWYDEGIDPGSEWPDYCGAPFKSILRHSVHFEQFNQFKRMQKRNQLCAEEKNQFHIHLP